MAVPSVHGNRAWCFTLNNPDDEEKQRLPTSLPDGNVQYADAIIYQLESGANNTPHYQGYVRFNRQRTLAHVKTFLPRAHWEPAKGSIQQNVDYCGKLDGQLSEPIIIGFGSIRPGLGGVSNKRLKRADFIALLEDQPDMSTADLLNKGGLEVLATQPNLLGILKGFLLKDNRRDGVVCHFYYGDTGCGKSRLASHLFPSAFPKGSGPWWDGYAGESEVILDDFDDAFMPIGDLLRLLDRYPLRTPVKGSYVQLVANTFIITSNHLPSEWYPDASPKRIAAILRRLKEITIFHSNGTDITTYKTAEYLNPQGTLMPPVGQTATLPWLNAVLPAEVFPESRPMSPSSEVSMDIRPLRQINLDYDSDTSTMPMYPPQ
uniref:Replication-associated protein n=1 Tax=Red panda feces-associated circular DNA virus 3 TaxID=2863978 RepID=A0A8K1M5E2_9VIRU|nr:replication-associated protein [Red panda feces-associated circular DNA virus 3]